MPIERNIFFSHHIAYSIRDTIQHVVLCYERLGQENFPTEIYDSIISDLVDLKYLVVTSDDAMVDIYNHEMVPRSTWFRRFGIQDQTFAHFDGDFHSVGTIEMCDLTITSTSITSADEEYLVEGSRYNPIVLDYDEDDTLTLLTIELSSVGEHDWEVLSDEEEISSE